MFISKIIISEDFLGIKEEMINNFGIKKLRFFIPQMNFYLMMQERLKKKAISQKLKKKIIVLMADSYRIEAQNFLLKLLEEPPKNIKFLIVIPSKNLLLPTIKSRLICEKRKVEKEVKKLDLDLKRMDLRMLFDFLQKNENLDKNELMDQIALLAKECVKYKDFNAEELEFFYESYELAKLNSKSGVLLATLLLNYYTKK